jgi:hypothetical protein
VTCPCNCGRPVKPGRTYAAKGCYARHRPEVMRVRSRKALLKQWGRRKVRSPDWKRGQRAGYMRASRYWKAWAKRQLDRQKVA